MGVGEAMDNTGSSNAPTRENEYLIVRASEQAEWNVCVV